MSAGRPEPRWISRAVAFAIHADQARQHGGFPRLRDQGLLESALERAPNRWRYDPTADLCALAAAYGIGLAQNHPFVDGNKRTAFQVMYVFLGLNGLRIIASEPEVVTVMLAVAGGELNEEGLTEWLRNCTKSGEISDPGRVRLQP